MACRPLALARHTRVQALEQANASQRKELDWQSQYEALSNARRVIHNHASVLVPCLHQFVLAAAPAIDSLRSIPARLAITVFQVRAGGRVGCGAVAPAGWAGDVTSRFSQCGEHRPA